MSATEVLHFATQLATARREFSASSAELRRRREQFDADNADIIRKVKEDQVRVDLLDRTVRSAAEDDYHARHENHPCAGIEIAISNEYAIDEAAGLVWAQQHDLCLIPQQLDVAAVKKLARVQRLPFVVVTERPLVRVASDLDKALAMPASAEAAAI
jgi:hypothetical protein